MRKKQLLREINLFLKSHWDQNSPILLGYSGGPDSEALLHLLLKSGVPPFLLHLAHLDHGWRKESCSEADQLEKKAHELGLFFHRKRLESFPEKNREEAGRKARLSFFKDLFASFPFQALVLAHQADDLAETVLKRVLEGAAIYRIGGMRKVSYAENNLLIWRPLLDVRKKVLLDFLEEEKISFLKDPSNDDSSYLRSRMRKEIFPFLEKSFKKQFINNLILLSKRSFEVSDHLERKIGSQKDIDLFSVEGLDPLEAKFLLDHEMKRKKIALGDKLLVQILEALFQKKEDLSFPHDLKVHQGKLFFKTKKRLFDMPS